MAGDGADLHAATQRRRGFARARAAESSLRAPEGEERLILATGRYLGEGFDDSRLDTLFVTMPISWKGTLAQYVGRLHRDHTGKQDVVVYDYIDAEVPVLARMAKKRQAGYRALGYRVRATSRVQADEQEHEIEGRVGDDQRPSQVLDRYWIHAENRNDDSHPGHGSGGGKWMLFIKTTDVDDWWAKIKSATESGHLGYSAKVATMKPNPMATGKSTRLATRNAYHIQARYSDGIPPVS